MSVLAYNVKGDLALSSEPARGMRIAEQVSAIAPALIALSECQPCQALIDQMPDGYQLVTEERSGVTAAYDRSLWRVDHRGFLTLGGNDDGWGERVALWVDFEEIGSGARLLFYSTHWCVSVRSPDDACDVARQLDYADTILDHARWRASPSTPVIIAGDLNAAEGSDGDAVPRAFAEAGYVDAVRAIEPDQDIVTLDSGVRVDYVFGSKPVVVLDAYVDESVPFELGSDHWPVIATLEFP